MRLLSFILEYLIDYRTRAIITRSWFETALDYEPWILGPTFLVYVSTWRAYDSHEK